MRLFSQQTARPSPKAGWESPVSTLPLGISTARRAPRSQARRAVSCQLTGRATFAFDVGGRFPFSSIAVAGAPPIDAHASGLRVEAGSASFDFHVTHVRVHATGPIRTEIELRAGAPGAPVDVTGRVELFAGTATARVQITLRNPNRARHPGGQWVLGDAGSVSLRSAVLLRDIQELSYQEIADKLELPEGTVKSRINRGRTELARQIRRLRDELETGVA